MIPVDIQAQIEAELAQAESARQSGYEGRARVNARRAAGMAVRAVLLARGTPVGAASLLEVLRIYFDRSDTPAEIRQILEHLLARVDPNFTLPAEIDLIDETRRLVNFLKED